MQSGGEKEESKFFWDLILIYWSLLWWRERKLFSYILIVLCRRRRLIKINMIFGLIELKGIKTTSQSEYLVFVIIFNWINWTSVANSAGRLSVMREKKDRVRGRLRKLGKLQILWFEYFFLKNSKNVRYSGFFISFLTDFSKNI